MEYVNKMRELMNAVKDGEHDDRARICSALCCLMSTPLIGVIAVFFVEPFHFAHNLWLPNVVAVPAKLQEMVNATWTIPMLNATAVAPHWETAGAIPMPEHLWPANLTSLPVAERESRPIFWLTFMLLVVILGSMLGTAVMVGGSRLLGGSKTYRCDCVAYCIENTDCSLQSLWCAEAVAAHLAIVSKITLTSVAEGTVSHTYGLAFEAFAEVLLCGVSWTVIQAVSLVLLRGSGVPDAYHAGSGAYYGLTGFGEAVVTALTGDPFDTLKDAVFAGVALTGRPASKVIGVVSLMYLYALHVFVFTREDMKYELCGAYLSVFNTNLKAAKPKQDAHVDDQARQETPLLSPPSGQSAAGSPGLRIPGVVATALFKQATPERRWMLAIEDGPQVILAVLYSISEGSIRPLIAILNIALPLAKLLYSYLTYGWWLTRREVWCMLVLGEKAAEKAGNDRKRLWFRGHILAAAGKLNGPAADSGEAEVHRDVVCDGCGMDPIVGLRYRSRTRDNYDLCKACYDSEPRDPQGWIPSDVDGRGFGIIYGEVLGEHDLGETFRTRWYSQGYPIGGVGASSLAEALKRDTRLETLMLDAQNVGDVGAWSLGEALRVNTTLRHLNLEANRIGDAGVLNLAEAVKVNGRFESLHLACNDVGNAGASSLAEALRKSRSLKMLNLNENDIEDAGAASIAESLRVNRSLAELDMRDNRLTVAGKALLREVGASRGGLNIKV